MRSTTSPSRSGTGPRRCARTILPASVHGTRVRAAADGDAHHLGPTFPGPCSGLPRAGWRCSLTRADHVGLGADHGQPAEREALLADVLHAPVRAGPATPAPPRFRRSGDARAVDVAEPADQVHHLRALEPLLPDGGDRLGVGGLRGRQHPAQEHEHHGHGDGARWGPGYAHERIIGAAVHRSGADRRAGGVARRRRSAHGRPRGGDTGRGISLRLPVAEVRRRGRRRTARAGACSSGPTGCFEVRDDRAQKRAASRRSRHGGRR